MHGHFVVWTMFATGGRDQRAAYVRLDKLVDHRYELQGSAHEGQELSVTEPFSLEFDPAELLEPRA